MRGLFYVHLYGAFEKSISEGVEQYLQQIADLQIPHAHFIPQFFPTALDALFTSLQSDSKRLKKRVDFVKKMASTDLCRINNSLFSAQLQNAWPETLLDISAALGISQSFFSNAADSFYLHEIVEKRNQVAHGRNSPFNVGSRGRSDELELRLEVVVRVIDDFLGMLELNLNSLDFVVAAERAVYLPALPS